MKANKTFWVSVLILTGIAVSGLWGDLLFEPYPRSTVLDKSRREPVFTVNSRVPTVCRYSVNEDKAFGDMLPFDSVEPGSLHTVTFRGLDTTPGVRNTVYVKCADSDETLELLYRFMSERELSLSGAALTDMETGEEIGPERLGRISLLSSPSLAGDAVEALKQSHPGLLCLRETFLTCAPDGLEDELYLRDAEGRRIEAFPGRFRLDMASFDAGSLVAGLIYGELSDTLFAYDGCLLMDMVMKEGEIFRDCDPEAKHSPAAGFSEEAWYKGILYTLRNLRWLYPYGVVTARTSADAEDTSLFKLLNGKAIVFSPAKATAESCRAFLAEYQQWMSRVLSNKVVLIEYVSEGSLPVLSGGENARARKDYSLFRFAYALSRLNDGIFTTRTNEFVADSPWFDEYGFDLGKPVSKAKYYTEADGVYGSPRVINAVNSVSSGVFRRDFENGIVLVNGEDRPVRIALEEEYSRFVSEQAPLFGRVYDNGDAGVFAVTGSGAGKALPGDGALAPGEYVMGDCVLCPRTAAVSFSLEVPFEDLFSLEGSFPAPAAGKDTAERIYCDLFVNGEQAGAEEIELAPGKASLYRLFGDISLKPGDHAEVRFSADGLFAADFIYLASKKRFNDGSSASEVTLEPGDGILLRKNER